MCLRTSTATALGFLSLIIVVVFITVYMAQMVESDAALGHAWEKMMCLLKVDASLLQSRSPDGSFFAIVISVTTSERNFNCCLCRTGLNYQ